MKSLKLFRTGSDDKDFIELVRELDKVLMESDGEDHPFYDQFNKLDNIKHVVIAYSDGTAAGCGSIKRYDNVTAEVKRMYVHRQFRSKGIGRKILEELELWAKELNYSECILETGKKQKEAVGLYLNSGYEIIPNYGQYAGAELSICMRKKL